MKTARHVSVILLAMVALAACSSDLDGGNNAPSRWIQQEYGSDGSVGYVDNRDGTSAVAKEIEGHTSARDRISDNGKVFLRYRNDIVAITPYLSGSRIEIDEYRTGLPFGGVVEEFGPSCAGLALTEYLQSVKSRVTASGRPPSTPGRQATVSRTGPAKT